MSVLIIGYGNTLRGDDGLGWVAAEQLEAKIDRDDVDIMRAHQLTFEMVEDVYPYDHLILIDVTTFDPPGHVNMKKLQASRESYGLLEHHVHPEVVLTTCMALHGRAPESYLFTIGGEDYDFRESLTETLQNALPELINQIMALLQTFKA